VAWPSHATLPTVFGKVLGECGQALLYTFPGF
jgi:hypothetical protein